MKLTHRQPERQPRVPAHTVLELEQPEPADLELRKFLHSKLFIELSKFVHDGKPIVLIPLLKGLCESSWIGAVDPEYLETLRNRSDVKNSLFEDLRIYEEGLAVNLVEDPTNLENLVSLGVLVYETGSTVAQLYPEERTQERMSQFSLERLESLLGIHPRGYQVRISKAYALVTLWPQAREKILTTLFPPEELDPSKLRRYFSQTPRPPTPTGITQKARSHDDDLGNFLLLFPDFRPVLSRQIAEQVEQIKTKPIYALPSDLQVGKSLHLQKELLILSAQEAGLDVNGRLFMNFQKPRIVTARPLPDRLNT